MLSAMNGTAVPAQGTVSLRPSFSRLGNGIAGPGEAEAELPSLLPR